MEPIGSLATKEHPYASFRDLMRRRISDILLVSSRYDSFIMEEDGGLVEQISSKYLDLHLSRAPRLHRVSSAAEALDAIGSRSLDLVVTMKQTGEMDAFAFGREVKRRQPGMPVVLLLHRMSDVLAARARVVGEGIDRVFMWSGDSGVFLAMIKSIEDMMNVDDDVATAGVRVVLLVEDSPAHYSSFLPLLYSEIMRHCQALLPEDINTTHRLYRMRARPKILLARTYEEAQQLMGRYRNSLLAVISDIQLPRRGETCPDAGLSLRDDALRQGLGVPYMFLSAQEEYRSAAETGGASFICKHSPSLAYELRDFIAGRMGFGDFVFRMPDGAEAGRAHDVTEFESLLKRVPDECLRLHIDGRHFSNWFVARGEFPLAAAFDRQAPAPTGDMAHVRRSLIEAIARNAIDRRRGSISDFSPQGLGQPSFLMRLGQASVGGKARGLAFMSSVLAERDFSAQFPGLAIRIPRTLAVSVGEFERFVDANDLRPFASESADDGAVAEAFVTGNLQADMARDLEFLVDRVHYPLAVRSSSLLEDSHSLPFAGIYSTYMLPNCHPDREVRREQLHRAVKLVYASVFFAGARRYLEAVNVRVAEEKMGIVIQEMVGRRHGDRFYPDVSGVAHSYNYYAADPLRPEDGVAHVALGLGRIVTSDGTALRFCPASPRTPLQFGSVRDFLGQTQRQFYALDMAHAAEMPGVDDGSNLLRCTLETAEADGALDHTGAVYSAEDDAIRDGLGGPGPRVVNFGNVLRYDTFPLATIMRQLLELGQEGMGCPVELEFAANLPGRSGPGAEFDLLQIRPMHAGGDEAAVDIDAALAGGDVLCSSTNTLSNGVIEGIRDVVYVRPDRFDTTSTKQIAAEFGEINRRLLSESKPYLAIGMGRWGTSETSLGIPVDWSQICGARALVETGRSGYVIEPSHGTHFFQNMTSLHVAYLNVHPERDPMDWGWLDAQEAVIELEHVRHVRTPAPLRVVIDGRRRLGAVLKR